MAAHLQDPLVTYFLEAYEKGERFRHSDYEETLDVDVTGVEAYQHIPSGIKVWQHAIDLRAGHDGPHAVVFHYTSPVGFANIGNDAKSNNELFASMMPQYSHFGEGIYCIDASPSTMGSKRALLLNNYWPRCGDPKESQAHEANLLKHGGGPASGPEDPQNAQVCSAILENPRRKHAADYCVPILVPCERLYDFRTRPMDGFEHGHSRWGEAQYAGRKVKIIAVKLGEKSDGSAADLRVKVMRLQLEALLACDADVQ
jgi:hypothetical protein